MENERKLNSKEMKYNKVASISLFLFILLISCVKSTAETDMTTETEEEEKVKTYTLRVLTYNIFHGETTLGKIDMDLFGQIIQDEAPDLVALQEVDKGTTRSGGIDQTAALSTRTGLTGYFAKARDFQGGDYGVAILSRLPVEDFKVVPAYKTGTYGTA